MVNYYGRWVYYFTRTPQTILTITLLLFFLESLVNPLHWDNVKVSSVSTKIGIILILLLGAYGSISSNMKCLMLFALIMLSSFFVLPPKPDAMLFDVLRGSMMMLAVLQVGLIKNKNHIEPISFLFNNCF